MSYKAHGAPIDDCISTVSHQCSASLGIGGFAALSYWSSSENEQYSAWLLNFNDGMENPGTKGFAGRVHAARAFLRLGMAYNWSGVSTEQLVKNKKDYLEQFLDDFEVLKFEIRYVWI